MVLLKKWPLFQLFFLADLGQENVFYDILERKKTFLRYKNKKFKKSKNWHFSQGVNPWFWLKNGDFSNLLFFKQFKKGKCLLRYSGKKKRLSKLLKQEVQKVEKLTFFQRAKTMVFVQKWPFFQLFFLGNVGKENVFHDILERKSAFLSYKNKKFKKSKNSHFSKGVNPWFLSKNGHFSNFFF